MVKKINGLIIVCVVLILVIETARGNYPWKLQQSSRIFQTQESNTPSSLEQEKLTKPH